MVHIKLIIESISREEVKVQAQRWKPKVDHITPDSIHMDFPTLGPSVGLWAARGGCPQRAECSVSRQLQLDPSCFALHPHSTDMLIFPIPNLPGTHSRHQHLLSVPDTAFPGGPGVPSLCGTRRGSHHRS